MTLVPVTNTTGRPEAIIPAPPAKVPVSLDTLEIPTGGFMITGRYAPHEYCGPCSVPILQWNPNTTYRTISVYEALTSYRVYTCSSCGKPLWDTNRKDDD